MDANVLRAITLSFYKEVARLEHSLYRRDHYISIDTPVCEVNWCDMFDDLPQSITVSDLLDELRLFENLYGKVSRP